MKEFLLGQLAYNQAMNTAFVDYFNKNKDALSERSIALMSHILLVHKLWNHMITKDPPVTDWWATLDVDEMQTMDVDNRALSERILNNQATDTAVEIPNPRGGTAEFVLGDIVFHITNHSNYHRGQINAELRQIGLEPRKTDYIFYKAMGN